MPVRLVQGQRPCRHPAGLGDRQVTEIERLSGCEPVRTDALSSRRWTAVQRLDFGTRTDHGGQGGRGEEQTTEARRHRATVSREQKTALRLRASVVCLLRVLPDLVVSTRRRWYRSSFSWSRPRSSSSPAASRRGDGGRRSRSACDRRTRRPTRGPCRGRRADRSPCCV